MPKIKKPDRLVETVRAAAGALVAFGRHPFSTRRDEADGAKVAGYRLIRGPDGRLYGFRDEKDR